MVKENKFWIIPAAVILAALIVAIGLNFSSLTGKNAEVAPQIQVPNYLTKAQNNYNAQDFIPASDGAISFAADNSGNQARLLSVSGTVLKTTAPDKATVVFSVETTDKHASKSQSDNAELAAKVMAALKNAGIADKDIKTVSYNLNEEFQWNETLRKSESIGYRTTNSVQVSLTDLSKTGSVIDAAVQAGANNVSSVSFGLSSDKESALKIQALKEAAEAAKVKAESIASGLGITVGQVYSAQESSNYYIPNYKNYAMESAAPSAGVSTPITPGDIEFSATVSVQFEIQ
ncbi:MAG: SIMPL domain-containing protein [Candidatus Diapherotrites archaeon]|nr:SIMPL domain-containing protein [Candidatus Diapherotrites archaeon]